MNTEQVIREAASISGNSLRSVSSSMGKSANYIGSTLNQGSTPKADTLASMLEPCGYSLAAIPKEDLPNSALVIDPANKE